MDDRRYDYSYDELYHPEYTKCTCEICGDSVLVGDIITVSSPGGLYPTHVCPKCEDNVKICEDCGRVAHYEDMTECIGGDGEVYYLCSNCIGGIQIAEVEAFC